MLLKKQTVWLLTMLSLVVVLSVYYITTPQKPATNMTATEEKKDSKAASKQTSKAPASQKDNAANAKVKVAPASDEVFEALRMDMDDERSKQKEDLTLAMADPNISAKEKSVLLDKIQNIDTITEKEGMLETFIVSMNYDSALVRIDGNDVNVTVKAKKLSYSAANDIIQLVTKELGSGVNVAVKFQPEK